MCIENVFVIIIFDNSQLNIIESRPSTPFHEERHLERLRSRCLSSSSFHLFVSNSCSNLSSIDASDFVDAAEYLMHHFSKI